MGELTPGTVLGGCRIDGVVGRGGMGVVYRAHQLDLDRDVALKVIAPELVEDPQIRQRFLTEARAAGAVEHPNVVPVHGVGVAEGRAYLVMRYVAGSDLRTVVRAEGPLEPQRAAGIAMRLGDALDAIHRAGYVHRDVKPQNVMVDAAGHVYLSDFGLAKQTLASSGQTRSEQWVGTLDYVAPEQIRGERVDARADVYSLGGVLYFMLTGRVPFEREADQAKLWAHLADPPPRPSESRRQLPPELDAVVLRALAKDPAERYPSAGDLGRAARAAAGLPGDSGPERTVARGAAAPATTVASRSRFAPVRAGRRRGPVLAAAALIVAAAVVALVLLDGDGGQRDRAALPTATSSPQPTATPKPVRVGATIRKVGVRPFGIAVVDGDAWVVSAGLDRLTCLDLAARKRCKPEPFVATGTSDIERDGDMVWVANQRHRQVVGVSTRTGSVIQRIRTTQRPMRVAAGPSGLWIVERELPEGPALLMHYDRDGTTWLGQSEFPAGIAALTYGGGYLWLALERKRRVLRIPRDGTEPEHGGWLNAPATELAYGAGYLWASVREEDAVARINPRTGITLTRAAANNPGQLAVARNRVFVASNLDDTVVVLDARTRKPVVDPLDVPANPHAVEAGDGHVWVAGLGANTLTRIDYRP